MAYCISAELRRAVASLDLSRDEDQKPIRTFVRPPKPPTIRKQERPNCGARTRAGGVCRAKVVEGKQRCRIHGGLSTGPKTAKGRRTIAEANRRRAAERQIAAAA